MRLTPEVAERWPREDGETEIVELPVEPRPWMATDPEPPEVPYAVDRADPTSLSGLWSALSRVE